MNLDEQRRFFLLEFASYSDRALRCMAAMIIALLGVVLAQSFFSIGGVNAQYLIYTFGLLSLAVGTQILVFWARIGRGFRISGIIAVFLPWFLLLCLDAFVLSDTPWRAKYTVCTNLLPMMAFFVAIHTSRTKKTRWWLIALTSMLVLISGLVEFLNPQSGSEVALAGGGTIGQSVRQIFGSFGNTAAMGAVLLLAFFAMAFLVISPRFKMWVRLFGLYMSVLFFFGIVFTRHAGVYLGLVCGLALSVQVLVRRRLVRYALFVFLAVLSIVLWTNSNTNVGCLTKVPVPAQIQKGFSAEERLEHVDYLLPYAAVEMFKENPVFGVGSGRFVDEFEKYRTPQWQTNPKTAGSLYLTLLAEHGIVGVLFFVGPLVFLMFLGLSACGRLPWQVDTERAALRRKMGIVDLGSLPEERIVLAAMLSGLLAVGVLFAIDYPCHIPGVSIACAIFGGIAAFLMSIEWRRTIIYSGSRRHILLPIAFIAPIVLMLIFLPTFRAEAEYQKGVAGLRTFFLSATSGESGVLEYEQLEKAEKHLRSALNKSPGHGDAWCALAEKYVFDCQHDPMHTRIYGKYIWSAATQALACSSSVPAFYQMRAMAEMVDGDFDAVREDLEYADAFFRYNAPRLLLSAEILRVFPQGVDDAVRLLDRIVLLLPQSHYVESLQALMSFGGYGAEQDESSMPTRETFIPEF